MSTLLRPSTRQVARLATLSFRTAPRSAYRIPRTPRSAAASIRLRQAPRFYSTESPKKPEGDDKKVSNGEEISKKGSRDAEPARKDEPDTSEESRLNAKEDGVETNAQKGTSEPPRSLPQGWVYLTEEELKILQSLSGAMPTNRKSDMDSIMRDIKKYGSPIELRELLVKHSQRGLGLADAIKAFKIAHKVASRIADKETETMFNQNQDLSDHQSAANPQHDQDKSTQKDPRKEGQEEGQERDDQQKEQQQNSKQNQQGKPGEGGQQPEGGKKMFDVQEMITWAIAAALFYPFYFMIFGDGGSRDITWQELRKNFLNKGLVERLVVSGDRVRVELNREALQSVYPDSVAVNPGFHYYINIGSVEVFERQLDEAQTELGIPASERIPVSYMKAGAAGSLLMAFGPTLLMVGLLFWLTRRSGGGGMGGSGVFGVGKSKAKRFNHETAVKVKFADVAGMDEAKLEIMEFVSFLKTPERFQKLGAKIPRGAILAGPPGTGKTLLAKATAGESGVPFFSVSGSEFVEMFVGVGASRVRDLFATARKSTPCIIFIDEIDAIGKARSEGSRFGGNDEREATLNQILTEMDGFNTSEQVVVLAGTNRADMLDKALTRPGRFDRHILIDRPTMSGRTAIFKVHLKKIVTGEDIEYLTGRLAALTPGFSGADIANAVNEAALVAARANASSVEMIHFEQAIERVIGGLERKSLVLNPEEKRTVAYHEAGHAICGWFFRYADPLLKVSIIPRGQGALGYAQYLPTGDAYLMNRNQLMDRMAMTLGGRVSEELHFPTVTTGASDDFKKVTRMATTMVTEWGMSDEVGPLFFHQDQNQFQKPFAEATALKIDAEVRRIVDEAYKQCKDLLVERKKEVGIVAEELLRKEMLDRDDMIRLLGERPFKDKEEFAKFFDGTRGKKSAPPPFPTETTDDTPPEGPQPAVNFEDQPKK